MTRVRDLRCYKCGKSVADGAALTRVNDPGDPFIGKCIGGCHVAQRHVGVDLACGGDRHTYVEYKFMDDGSIKVERAFTVVVTKE